MTTVSLVGARHRKPALGLLAALPAGSQLFLLAEPSNPYDPQAIQVFVATADLAKLPPEDLATALCGYGYSLEDILAQPSWHLGYVAKVETSKVHPVPPEGLPGLLAFDSKGWPRVKLCEAPPKEIPPRIDDPQADAEDFLQEIMSRED